MEPTEAGRALYLIQVEMGGTAGPYDLRPALGGG